MKSEIPGSDTLDFYLEYLIKQQLINDKAMPYRESGSVLEKHGYKLTEQGQNAVKELSIPVQKFHEFF